MIKKLIEGGKQFYIPQKESYGFEDVKNIIDQHTSQIIGQYDQVINDEISLLKATAETAEATSKESADSYESLKTEKETAEALLKAAEDKLLPFQEIKKTNTAKEIFTGLVTTGAEVDTFNLLGDALKDLELEKVETLEGKQELVKPLLEDLFKNKTYLKPATIAAGSDDEEIIVEEIGAKPVEVRHVSIRPGQ